LVQAVEDAKIREVLFSGAQMKGFDLLKKMKEFDCDEHQNMAYGLLRVSETLVRGHRNDDGGRARWAGSHRACWASNNFHRNKHSRSALLIQ